jgi:tRNA G18 (ribose-2'-O)-methylase SpoU
VSSPDHDMLEGQMETEHAQRAELTRISWCWAQGVVACSRNSASLSPTVSKASAGALELMPVYSVRNMVKFLESCKARGYITMGTALDTNVVPLKETK